MEVKVKETRGRKPKYDFSDMAVGSMRRYESNLTSTILISANRYSKNKNLDWKFRCYRDEDGLVVIIRTK